MFQPTESLPEVARHPAPWNLRGSAWIVALKLPPGSPARDAFLPHDFAGQARGLASYLMYVDYAESGCGPYRELLFIPGTCPFGDGRRHLTISRIVVSTWDSVVNGRLNWGIPKDRADFEARVVGREHHITVSAAGRELCHLQLESGRLLPPLPAPLGLVPERFRTMAQRFEGRSYYYAPSALGRVRPGRLVSWRFDAELFPDLSDAAVVAALEVEQFRMTFGTARVVAAG